ncbi:MAG TPA: transglycosylase domain-containing protein [Candidatus Babeliales bacterium]|jgi:penicillin-binding protein 1A|nr:transglycosylase domain-containing protein [Candidatus Babeliales bacterium]
MKIFWPIRYFFIGTVVLSAFLCGALFFVMHNHTIDFSILAHYDSARPSILYDDWGNECGKFQLDRRDPVDGARLPQHVINAFIAAEDWHFFTHHGISWKGIARSIVVNLYYGRKAQGASTITQQLVKLLFFDSQKTFTRKIKEQLYAILVEQQLTKEQILHTYLNNVCFGCGIYGIEAASQRFWSKHAHEISIDEACTLAGIIRSPARYCPLVYPLSAQKRRDVILGKMKHLGFITPEEYENLITYVVAIKDKYCDSFAPHIKEMLRISLENIVGKTILYSAGLHIQTTINSKMQIAAQEAFTTEMVKLREKLGNDLDGGMIVLDRKTGEIKALVGGFDFATSKFNRAMQARRQIGSIIKPLIYTCAIQQGMTFADTELDEPFELLQNGTVWAPKNYDKKFHGKVTLAYALSRSSNIVSIKILLKVGAQAVINLAKKCRVTTDFHTYPSLALGCIDTTLCEGAGMFNVFTNDGVYVEPHLLSWIKDRWGTRIYKPTIATERILDNHINGQIKAVLCLGPERVKLRYGEQHWITSQAMSKTGTTNDSRTCWFIGSTPTLTTAVYVGFDDNRPMGNNVYPIHTAFPIWLAFNRVIDSTEKTFSYDPLLQLKVIDEHTGLPSTLGKSGAISILV